MNQPLDLEDLNRRLATLSAQHGFLAAARKIPGDDVRVELDVVTWRDGKPLHYRHAYPISEIERLGPVAVANAFVEAARQALPRGTPSP